MKPWNILGWILVAFIVLIFIGAMAGTSTTVTTNCDSTYTSCTYTTR